MADLDFDSARVATVDSGKFKVPIWSTKRQSKMTYDGTGRSEETMNDSMTERDEHEHEHEHEPHWQAT
jgi:hypothetical protein